MFLCGSTHKKLKNEDEIDDMTIVWRCTNNHKRNCILFFCTIFFWLFINELCALQTNKKRKHAQAQKSECYFIWGCGFKLNHSDWYFRYFPGRFHRFWVSIGQSPEFAWIVVFFLHWVVLNFFHWYYRVICEKDSADNFISANRFEFPFDPPNSLPVVANISAYFYVS